MVGYSFLIMTWRLAAMEEHGYDPMGKSACGKLSQLHAHELCMYVCSVCVFGVQHLVGTVGYCWAGVTWRLAAMEEHGYDPMGKSAFGKLSQLHAYELCM